jgi:putative mRNA 3-end processing factor
MLISVNNNGLYCAKADVYIDPWRPVKRALISHGHSDHMRWGNKYYLCQHDTVPVLKVRIGQDVSYESIGYGEIKLINGVSFSFHPAGHILGSSQIKVEYKGEIWVFTGDYKLYNDGLSQQFEPVLCNHFITESTFGFQPPLKIFEEIRSWWIENQTNKINTIILCYSLGKAQSILNYFKNETSDIYLHGAVANLNDAFLETGYNFGGNRIVAESDRKIISGGLIIAPPSAAGTPWMRTFGDYRVAMCSGWMQLRGARRRKGVDKGFVFSDHCDFDSLNQAVKLSKAENVYVTHGYEIQYAKWVEEAYGLRSSVIKTLYNEDEREEL